MEAGESKPRGAALGTVLACMVALSIILTAAVSAGISQLRLAEASTRQEHARNLAEAALARAIAKLGETDFAFGTVASDRLDVTVDGLRDAVGTVTFDRNEPGFEDGYSLRNLDRDSTATGAGGCRVPGRTVHLVARGKVSDTVQWMECVYYRPPFPDGLAATGPVDAKGLFLTGVREDSAYQGGDPASIPPEQFRPANLFSNSARGFQTGPGTSVTIGAGCNILGSAGSVGSISVDPNAVIRDEVLPGSEPRAIPQLDLASMITSIRENAVEVSSGGSLTLNQDWYAVSPGPLTVSDLDLNGTALAVNGDLTVNGPISGTGILVVDGNVKIADGRSDVTSSDQVAIGCTGNFELSAEAPEGNYFQGIIYCEGDLQAKDITVFGAMVINGQEPATGSAILDNVRFIQSPGKVEVALDRWEGFDMKYDFGCTHDQAKHFTAMTVLTNPDKEQPPPDEDGNPVGRDYVCRLNYMVSDVRTTGGVDPWKLEPTDPYKDKPQEWERQFEPGPDLEGIMINMGLISVPADHQPVLKTVPPFKVRYHHGRTGEDRITFLDPNTGRAIAQAISTDARKGGDPVGDFSPDAIIDNVVDKIVAGIESDGKYSLTFNPNRLYTELLGSSRVMVWRPFRAASAGN